MKLIRFYYVDSLQDMLCVVAHGTPSARLPAANLLFYYWPSLNPTPVDRRNILGKYNTSPTWTPPPCCSPECQVNLVVKDKYYFKRTSKTFFKSKKL